MAFKSLLLLTCSGIFLVVDGCGQLQPGQERTISFTLNDFKLPAVMAYSEDATVKMKVSKISHSKSAAETFVRTLIRESIEDVLYQQGRSALLSDNVISSILQQIDIQIRYEPLRCDNVITDPFNVNNGAVANKKYCIIVEDTVTRICGDANAGANDCMMAMIAMKSKPVPPEHLSISGSVKTSNIVMANWSNQMWESVFSRVLRRIASSPNGSYFYGTSVKFT